MIPYFEERWFLVLAPILAAAVAWLLIAAYRRRARRLERLGAKQLVERLVPPGSRHSPRRRAALLGAAALCAGIAFAGPRWGVERNVQHGSGIDIVLALDASLSMLATDVRPSRLERMKDEARRLLAGSSGDRFGLVAFAGRSYILTPLTVDQGALSLFLDNLDPTVVGQAGSSLARAIRQGTDLLVSTETGSDRALVVMSDGEAFEPVEDVKAAAQYAAQQGVSLVTVGFGTTQGSTIPEPGARGNAQHRDENGQVVITRYTPEMLRSAAQAAGGTFIDAQATDKAARVRNALASLKRQARTAQAGRDRQPRFQLFLIPALLLVLADTWLQDRRARRKRLPAASRVAAALLLFTFVLPSTAFADEGARGDKLFAEGRYKEAAAAYQRAIDSGNDSPRLEYNLGTALLAAGRVDDAAAALERAATAATDSELRYRALYNLGLIHLNKGRAAKGEAAQKDFTAAVDAYKRALRLRPNENDAKWNYELANHNKSGGGGGGGGGAGGGGGSSGQKQNPADNKPQPQPQNGGLDRQQAEELLNSAAREERDVQAQQQAQNQPSRPPGGKDW